MDTITISTSITRVCTTFYKFNLLKLQIYSIYQIFIYKFREIYIEKFCSKKNLKKKAFISIPKYIINYLIIYKITCKKIKWIFHIYGYILCDIEILKIILFFNIISQFIAIIINYVVVIAYICSSSHNVQHQLYIELYNFDKAIFFLNLLYLTK